MDVYEHNKKPMNNKICLQKSSYAIPNFDPTKDVINDSESIVQDHNEISLHLGKENLNLGNTVTISQENILNQRRDSNNNSEGDQLKGNPK